MHIVIGLIQPLTPTKQLHRKVKQITKNMRRLVPYILLCSAAAAQVANSQSAVRAGFSPVPIWPQSGVLPDALQQQYVFFDPSTNEVVLNVPEDPAAPNNGVRKQVRFTLHNGTDPLVSVHIQPSAGGSLSYQYSIGNGSSARQPLETFALFVPANSGLQASHPSWKVDQLETGPLFAVADAEPGPARRTAMVCCA